MSDAIRHSVPGRLGRIVASPLVHLHGLGHLRELEPAVPGAVGVGVGFEAYLVLRRVAAAIKLDSFEENKRERLVMRKILPPVSIILSANGNPLKTYKLYTEDRYFVSDVFDRPMMETACFSKSHGGSMRNRHELIAGARGEMRGGGKVAGQHSYQRAPHPGVTR